MQEDSAFRDLSALHAEQIATFTQLCRKDRILDFGCGQGRLCIGLADAGLEYSSYTGLDVDQTSIAWAEKNLSPLSTKIMFQAYNAKNARYNPRGIARPKLPFEDDNFSVVIACSVFSHMLARDVAHYLAEFGRVLRPRAQVYLTAFLENSGPDVADSPVGYRGGRDHRPLRFVRYRRDYFFQLLEQAGFQVTRFRYEGVDRTGQSEIVAQYTA